ncbi:MAG TPA: aconitase X catalytic domain-containing protein [Candidatus Limnocylindria bacterium]|nr:aconitase X catalytic domain-containing protein [Candidatus Limnocylindria bacterium]
MSLSLTDRDRRLLDGAEGDGAAFAMRLVVRAAEVTGANRLIDITGAHVDSCLYHGQASLDFVDRLVDGGARVRVPATLNVGAVDLLHPELWRGDPQVAERGRLLMDRYRALGARPTFTCAPYQLVDSRPALGEQVAWGESNAIAFCNSVLGARTNRYGDFLDIAAAITGRVPDAGLHRTEARRATLVLRLADDVPSALRESDVLAPVMGIVLGRRAGSVVAAIEGLPPGQSEDRLKAIGAAAASSGSVAMFHVIGSTPEAPTLEVALQGQPPDGVATITLDELRAVRDELTTVDGGELAAVSLGTPHASAMELARYAALFSGARVADVVECVVSTGRDLLEDPANAEAVAALRAAGVELLVDTCSYISPVLRNGDGPVMTDSAKWAYYAPGNIGASVIFGSAGECVRSAIAGRVVRDDGPWRPA